MKIESPNCHDVAGRENRQGEGTSPQHLVRGQSSRANRVRIVPLLMTWFWSLAQHSCRFHTDTGSMALCALLVSRLIRFGRESSYFDTWPWLSTSLANKLDCLDVFTAVR